MRASNVSLVILAAMAAAFAGAFVGTLVGLSLGSRSVGMGLSFACMLGAAHLIGRWVGRRQDAPSRTELLAGAIAYVVLCVVLAVTAQRPTPIAAALIAGSLVAGILSHAANRAHKTTAAA
jgi:hypothetical protein